MATPKGCHNIQHNDTRPNDTQHSNNNNTVSKKALDANISKKVCNANAECRHADCCLCRVLG